MSKTVFERVALARKALVLGTAFCAPGAALLVPCAVRAATDDTTTTSIQRGPEAERALKTPEPSYETREERLKAKPLDWKTTAGKPTKPRKPTVAETAVMRKAKPGSTEEGKPHPNADAEARKLHPEEWK
ncbi:MAG: hypothetical protein IIA02_13320 [Proteobacteria bacterium]|uniref:hypothetical protein n=1 Tax=Aquabacterium sp. TaxID=1872578 RepID=UPI0035C76CE3|nr:hypothetical protein [Pseudomonadota bacterium]